MSFFIRCLVKPLCSVNCPIVKMMNLNPHQLELPRLRYGTCVVNFSPVSEFFFHIAPSQMGIMCCATRYHINDLNENLKSYSSCTKGSIGRDVGIKSYSDVIKRTTNLLSLLPTNSTVQIILIQCFRPTLCPTFPCHRTISLPLLATTKKKTIILHSLPYLLPCDAMVYVLRRKPAPIIS